MFELIIHELLAFLASIIAGVFAGVATFIVIGWIDIDRLLARRQHSGTLGRIRRRGHTKNLQIQEIEARVNKLQTKLLQSEEDLTGRNKLIVRWLVKYATECVCGICLDKVTPDKFAVTSCGHEFCSECTRTLQTQSGRLDACGQFRLTCPTCREQNISIS